MAPSPAINPLVTTSEICLFRLGHRVHSSHVGVRIYPQSLHTRQCDAEKAAASEERRRKRRAKFRQTRLQEAHGIEKRDSELRSFLDSRNRGQEFFDIFCSWKHADLWTSHGLKLVPQ